MEQTHCDTIPEEIKIPVPWGHISGKWWGSRDIQPVLAIHGWQDNAGTFDCLIPLLPADISVLCIDLPGHGLSSHYPPGQFYYIFWDGLTLVRRIVKHFGWSTVTLMGHSLGGAIGFLYAATFPNETDRLISFDIVSPAVKEVPVIADGSRISVDRFLRYEHLTSDSLPCHNYTEMIDIVQDAYRGSLTRESCEVMMRRGMTSVQGTNGHGDGYHFNRDVRLKVPGLGFLSMDIVLEYASRITCAYLNVRGSPGMVFDCPENYRLVLDRISKVARSFQFHEVPGTHHLHLNNPADVSPIITTFLREQHPVRCPAEA